MPQNTSESQTSACAQQPFHKQLWYCHQNQKTDWITSTCVIHSHWDCPPFLQHQAHVYDSWSQGVGLGWSKHLAEGGTW